MQGAETRSILSVMVLAQHLRPILNATTSPLFARLYTSFGSDRAAFYLQ